MNTYRVAGPELINTNVYGQLIASRELMSPSKQPYGVDTVVIPIYRWSPTLNKDSNVPRSRRYDVDSLGMHLSTCLPKWAVASGLSPWVSPAHSLNPADLSTVFAPRNVPLQSGLLLNRAMTLPFLVASFP